MEILSHINKRVKHRPDILLPMLDLLKIYTESVSSTMVRNFCVLYIEMAFERLPTEVFSRVLLRRFTIPAKLLTYVKLTFFFVTGQRKHCT
jgi:hypothetical protein